MWERLSLPLALTKGEGQEPEKAGRLSKVEEMGKWIFPLSPQKWQPFQHIDFNLDLCQTSDPQNTVRW